ncbi:chaperonin 10-like protein [Bisporella sp. PMI_857]|nr:chaperonin 10-like protein [Bisporella sp. PMI_857]
MELPKLMKEVIVHPTRGDALELWTEIHEVPLPRPSKDEVVIKVAAAGSNVKDWLHITNLKISMNSGDDVAGIVHEVGDNVTKFRVGDQVAAFHPMMTPGGAYAEYALAPQHTTFKIPSSVSFESAATMPLILTTAALTLFRRQHLPPPWAPRPSSSAPLPLIIYGASSALGAFAIKLARAANIHPIIAIAGSSSAYISSLLAAEKGDALIDYRDGPEATKELVSTALGQLECFHALDAISANQTWIPISQMLASSTNEQPSYLSVVSGANRYDESEIQDGVQIVYTFVGTVHSGAYKPGMPKMPKDVEEVRGDPEWAEKFFDFIAKWVSGSESSPTLEGHPFEIIEGGLRGVEVGLRKLKAGQAKGVKFVYCMNEQ